MNCMYAFTANMPIIRKFFAQARAIRKFDEVRSRFTEGLQKKQASASNPAGYRQDAKFLLDGFRKIDKNLDRFLTYQEFHDALGALGSFFLWEIVCARYLTILFCNKAPGILI